MRLIYSDSLTGLCNFVDFRRKAEIFLNRPELTRLGLTTCVFWHSDLRSFKLINDVLGYEEGDRPLRSAAELLRMVEGPDCISYRIVVDSFVGITWCVGTRVPDRGLCHTKEYMRGSGIDGQSFMEIPVGVYRFRSGDRKQSLDMLVNYANMTHEIAKERPGSFYVLYDDNIRERMLEDSTLEAEVETAMADDELKLYMQPKIDTQDGNRITETEVLIRRPGLGREMILSGNFIPLFEKGEPIVKPDCYMSERTCRRYRIHLEWDGSSVSLVVDVPKAGLLQSDFIDFYTDIKDKRSVPDGALELEFAESMLAADAELFVELVVNLNAHEFIRSLDDFSPGYSPLNLLKNLPIDVLKLDILLFHKSRDIQRERIVVSNVISMAGRLDIRTIAEDVKDTDIVESFRRTGCNVIQGCVFAGPMPQEDFEHLLMENQDGPSGSRDQAGSRLIIKNDTIINKHRRGGV